MASLFKITFLGTGGSWPMPGRAMPSVALQVDDFLCLFDCGEGTQKQLMKSGISFMKINAIFFSHFHGDHFLGVLGLVQSMSFNGRTETLKVYGPPGAISVLSRAFNTGYFTLGFDIVVEEIPFGGSVSTPYFDVKTLRADHPVPAISYRINEHDLIKIDPEKAKQIGIPSRSLELLRKNGFLEFHGKNIKLEDVSSGIRLGRSMVYSGDTRPNPEMVQFAQNATVFIHETTTDSSLEPKVNEFGHTSSRQAAEIALKANVGTMYLYHYSPRIEDPEVLRKEASSIFPHSILSKELLSVEVPKGESVLNQ